MEVYKAGVEAAYKAKSAWPGKEDIISAMEGVKVDSLGGPGQMRKDHIPEQTFYQGLTTHNNRVRLPDAGQAGCDVLGPVAEAARAWTSGSGSTPRRSSCRSALTAFFDILIGGVFHAAVLFLVAAGLQLVFGVQKIVNLACGSFYALGAYFGISAVNWAIAAGVPAALFLPVLLLSGLLLGAIGPPIEALLRTVQNRDEAFQLLLTFALVLMFQDVLRFFWGANPQQLGNLVMEYGKVTVGSVQVPDL